MNTREFDVSADTDLTTPEQLELFLRALKELLRSGALTHVRTREPLVTSVDFEQLNESGPWPDVIDEEFVDPHGRRFHLLSTPITVPEANGRAVTPIRKPIMDSSSKNSVTSPHFWPAPPVFMNGPNSMTAPHPR